jgi:hypothetical protein
MILMKRVKFNDKVSKLYEKNNVEIQHCALLPFISIANNHISFIYAYVYRIPLIPFFCDEVTTLILNYLTCDQELHKRNQCDLCVCIICLDKNCERGVKCQRCWSYICRGCWIKEKDIPDASKRCVYAKGFYNNYDSDGGFVVEEDYVLYLDPSFCPSCLSGAPCIPAPLNPP